jgi:hypothetical protein
LLCLALAFIVYRLTAPLRGKRTVLAVEEKAL